MCSDTALVVCDIHHGGCIVCYCIMCVAMYSLQCATIFYFNFEFNLVEYFEDDSVPVVN